MMNRIGLRLYGLVLLFALGCTAVAAAGIWLSNERSAHAREKSLEQIADMAIGVLSAQKKLADSGAVTEAEARKRAYEVISEMRFNGTDYVYALDKSGHVVFHPANAKYVGTDARSMKDAKGREWGRELAALAENLGSGYVEYEIIKPGTDVAIGKKAFVKTFRPWEVVLINGMFVDDLQVENWRAVRQAAICARMSPASFSGMRVFFSIILKNVSFGLPRSYILTIGMRSPSWNTSVA